MKELRKHIRTYIPLFVFSFVSVLLFFTNYVPETFLVGWDNLMPELDVFMNLKRNLFAVWQEYRGLGLIDGQAHSANLIHTLSVGFLRISFPPSMVRYVLMILLHLLGGLGMYQFAKHTFKNNLSSLVAGLFYMLNIGIIQQFYAPLENFIFHFALLPWIFLYAYRYIESKNKHMLFAFALASLLITPQAFVPTLFVTYMLGFGWIIVYDFLQNKGIKKSVVLIFVTLLINSFWLIPYLYNLPDKAQVIQSSTINTFSSEETFLRNKARGGINDVIQMKGFMVDFTEYNSLTEEYSRFMQTWYSYSNSLLYTLFYTGLVLIALLGLVRSSSKKETMPILGLTAVSFFFLANNTPGFDIANEALRQLFPSIAEAFRFPFTKFITLFAFGFSFLIAAGTTVLIQTFKKHQKAVVAMIFAALIIISLPAFTGEFFSDSLKQKLPPYYRSLFSYLDNQDENARVAILPMHTFWSWQSRDWGYTGSGFEWFGIKQPLLVRAFDPWSEKNEQFYAELSRALSSENADLFNEGLAQYNVSFLLLDRTLVNNLSTKPINFQRIERFLDATEGVERIQDFGPISLYTVDGNQSGVSQFNDQNVTAKPITPFDHNKEFGWSHEENAVVIDVQIEKDEFIPGTYEINIPSLFENEHLIPATFTLEGERLVIQTIYPKLNIDGKVFSVEGERFEFPIEPTGARSVTVNSSDSVDSGQMGHLRNDFLNIIAVGSEESTQFVEFDTRNIDPVGFTIETPLTSLDRFAAQHLLIADQYAAKNLIQSNPHDVVFSDNPLKGQGSCRGIHKSFAQLQLEGMYMESICDTTEITYSLNSLPHQASYVIFAHSEHISGLPLTLYIDNDFEKRSELNVQLSKDTVENMYILPKTQEVFNGYGFHVVQKSVARDRAVAVVNDLSIYPFSLSTLNSISIQPMGFKLADQKNEPVVFEKIGNFSYYVPAPQLNTLVLHQAFEPGWAAYVVSSSRTFTRLFPFIGGQKIDSQYKIDNWANAWNIADVQAQNSGVVILFWPQYLQFIGFGLMILALIYTFRKKS